MKKYTILWVDDCTPKTTEFKKKSEARKFAKVLVHNDSDYAYITGLVIGEYIEAKFDGEDKKLLGKLK